ncbi:MAG: ABC transporter substrate-binding protein [Propionibacteriaceae bacterium]|jgi:peptide/nickel transport system substrate-binding protein|nr:ABC transporter substrate-binding protein [Propionibacteriaceae bacterium]
MKIPRLKTVAVAILSVLALLAGCTPTAPVTGTPKVLTVGVTLEPATLDLTTSDAASIPQLLLYNVYETLVKMDSMGDIKPLLATSYDISDDGLVYTFHLDPKAKFASGTPVNADAVVASIERMRAGTSQSLQSKMAVVASVRTVDELTVAVTLRQPSNFWLYSMTSTPGIIMDPATTDPATLPMGSGPYAFDTWVKGDRITLKKNAAYWGTPARFDQVVFRYIPDANAMVSAMLSGDLDIAGEMTSPDSLPMFADTSKYTVIKGTTNGEVVLGFNHDRAAFQDRRVRQAICYAIDRQGLIDNAWGGQGQVIGSMSVPTDPYYTDLSGKYPYNPEKAKQLLAEAGVENLTLALRVPITPYAPRAATYIASQLAEVGITATVEELDFSSRWLPEVFLGGDYDLTIVAHVEARDIVNFANPDYYWHYNNPAFNAQIQKADTAPADEFVADMQKATEMLADDAAADWLFVFPNLIVTRTGIEGVGENATSLSFDVTTISAKD